MVFVEPRITVRVNGAAWLVLPTASCSPVGFVWKLSSAVCGCTSTLLVSVTPGRVPGRELELEVRRILVIRSHERAAGGPDEGRHRMRMAVDGQWWRITVHVSAVAGKVPSSASVALPEKLIGRPPSTSVWRPAC